ncbi:MAG TPA: UDP-N-acetyl-D-glucosamine dehydrogenase [Armatimonadetes bacterium]|nr:UDP-N-acetyl-D-glucosamine dehydrogenase [Armatimonadota bacterium]
MSTQDWSRELLDRLERNELRLGVIGLGYVGLPLACEFARAGIDVTGVDVSKEKVALVNAGKSYIGDIDDAAVAELVGAGNLRATTDFSVIRELDALSICVPTPLRKSKDPDISFVVDAMAEVAKYAHPGLLVVLESTTYPGTTAELIIPRLEEQGLVVGEDVFVAYSPERVDPGNLSHNTHNTPKVIGGHTQTCGDLAQALYERAVTKVVRVASPAAAEMVKLLENTFRAVNIGLVNEFAIMCDRLDLDVWDIIDAAATKPFGFMKFTPGPGLGGHCIPIDPLYLSWKLRERNYEARFIALADSINTDMPMFVVTKVMEALNHVGRAIRGSRILMVGVAYKPNVDDVRESPALTILDLLNERGGILAYHDPYVAEAQIEGETLTSVPLSAESVADYDVVLIITNHKGIDWDLIAREARSIVDTRNALAGREVAGTLVKL